jgi:hypothetical protein
VTVDEYEIAFYLHNRDTGEIRTFEMQIPIQCGRDVAARTARAIADAAVAGMPESWNFSGTDVRKVETL